MGDTTSGYSPVSSDRSGRVTVELGKDHPGVSDPVYRARRDAIAALALGHRPGDPVPAAGYSREEQDVWATVWRELAPRHERFATRQYLDAVARLDLPRDRIPQLREVTDRLGPLTGFRFAPVAGLAPLRAFYESFAERRFYSTQYIRHHSQPLYTPEPDVVHELIGHANQLADPSFAALYEAVGAAARRAQGRPALEFLSRVFWFTMEFGVQWEQGELRTYGAGILSSYGELSAFRDADIRPLDLAVIGRQDYDISHYQPVLYAARSFEHLVDTMGAFLAGWDDDAHARLTMSVSIGR